jgi:hypothetical protein
VSNRYDLICQLPPSLKHNAHAAVAMADKEPYIVIRLDDDPGKSWIQMENGQWLDVEQPPQNESQ